MPTASLSSSEKFSLFGAQPNAPPLQIETEFESFALTASLPGIFSWALMENAPYQKLLTKGHLALGAMLSLGVFILMSILLRPFTFSPDPLIAQLQACFTAIPITCVFWFAYHMFMLVLVDQRKRKNAAT